MKDGIKMRFYFFKLIARGKRERRKKKNQKQTEIKKDTERKKE